MQPEETTQKLLNENDIAQRLRENIHQEPEVPKPIVAEEPQPSAFDSNVELGKMMVTYKLYDYFEIPSHERNAPEVQDWMGVIYSWAVRESGSQELADILKIIQTKELEMGLLTKSGRLAKVYRYVKLTNQRKAIELEMNTL